MSKFMLEIVTPERLFFDGEVEMVIARGVEGDIGILKGHEPFVTPLQIGTIKIKIDGQFKLAAISQGYMQVTKDKVVILVDTAEWPEEIDVNRAEKARERAEKRLQQKTADLDILRAEIALKKATTRLGVAKMTGRH
ncbi:MAG TPA: F0F1 ATP synthase subunit epsilon [Clostridiales bacterium]|jgi:F-type H+-transporting ATPase subunit epsilon|nr:F0F1 ATP synthase subunit epsilon [Clostridiales bacterium]